MTSPTRPRARLAATFLPLLTTLVFSGGAARAQNVAPRDTSIDPQLFQPAIGPQNFLTVEGAQVPDHKRLSFGLDLNYQQRPYTVFTQGQSPGNTYIIDNQLTGELDAAIGLFNRYQVGVGIPFTPYLDGDVVDGMGMPAHLHLKESGIGDIRVEGKAHLATLGPDDQYDVAISAGLTLPTGHAGSLDWLGDKTVTGRIRAIGTADVGPVTFGANLGILIRATSHSFATEVGPQLLYGAAANFAVDAKTGIILEAAGRSGLNQFASFYSDVNPFEVDLAGRRALSGMWSLTGGVGRGVGSGIGAPDFRGFLMASFNPDFRDRDHDGVYDIDDKCPDQPEDRDGFQDSDGCPDPDNDKDGIPDATDKCPLQPETLNGIKDEDGCPDPGPEIVRLGQGRIEVDEKIGFGVRGGKLLVREPSAKVVNDVALVMKGHPEIAKLRIEVTADGVPKSETQRRADALRDYLVGKGVEAARIEAVGAGAGGSRIDFIVAATGPETPAAAPGKASQPAPSAPARPAGQSPPSPAPATSPRPPMLPSAPAPSPAPPVPPGAPVPGSH